MSGVLRRHWRALLAVGTLLLAAGALAAYVWIFADLPSLERLEVGMVLPSTRIYDRHGALLYAISHPESGRSMPIALEDVPPHCLSAVIATEDANYWSHPGVDLWGILRALWINLRGGEILAGGSTITQQTARLLLLDPMQQAERTLQRKLKEMVLAVRLQAALGKEGVLTRYLNQVYFGNMAYGLEAAARAYFQKPASALSLAECALLAGMIQNAALYDPLTNLERAQQRQRVVLGLMAQNGFISAKEAEAAARDPLHFASTPFPIEAPHAVMAVWKQLERAFPDALYTQGLEVTTTLDLTWQRNAERIVRSQLDSLNYPKDPSRVPANAHNAALVALHPVTGEVLVMLGSPNYFDVAIDGAVNAALALRQPGSTLKPFAYALAMQPDSDAPYTAATALLDVRTPFVTSRLESYTPANFALVEHGLVSVREALASSYNIPAVIALEKVTVPTFKQFMVDVGLESLAMNTSVDLSVVLGGGEVRLYDLVAAYSIFPNGGYTIKPTLIKRVETQDGALLYAYEPPPLTRRVLDERVAFLINDILSDNQARIPSFGRNSPLQIGRIAAAKTGTTTDFRDNWVVGYTPDIVVGVWVGNADNSPMVQVTGVSGAAPIYNAFMRTVLVGRPETPFTRPEGLVQREVCALSGLLPTPECPHRRLEWFIVGTEPTEYDNLYQVFPIDRRTGALATADTPQEYVVAQTFLVLPQEAQAWGKRKGILPPPEGAQVRSPDADAPLRLLSPDPYTVFELSPLLPAEAQRIRFRVATPLDTVRVVYWLNDAPYATLESAPFSAWWQLALGDYVLTAEAELQDGTRQSTPPLFFSVTERDDPFIGSYTLGE